MNKRCYYDVLGVSRSCSVEGLKGAYRKLAKELHPDTNPTDDMAEVKFKEINEAYYILKDTDKRAAYDRYGHAAFENGHGGRGPAGFDFGASFTDVFDDLFGEIMGGARRGARRVNRGEDLRYDLQISLEDAYRGRSVEIRVPSAVVCETCNGSGAKPGTMPETCPGCSGQGKVRMTHGFFTIERTCPKCKGQGKIVREKCRNCSGAGQVQKERTLSVDIPAGVENGTRIRLAGEGHAGLGGGPPGDFYIFLSLSPHPFFQRDAQDLYCRVPIPFSTAALGGTIAVPVLDGSEETIKIPEGTQSGRQFRLRRRGMPILRGSSMRGGATGDLIVEVQVETPTKLSKAQKNSLRQFAEGAHGTQPQCESFLANLKEFLGSRAQ